MINEEIKKKVGELIKQIQKDETPIFTTKFAIVELLTKVKGMNYLEIIGLIDEIKSEVKNIRFATEVYKR